MRLHTVCKYSINMHHNMYIMPSIFMTIKLPCRHLMPPVHCIESSTHWNHLQHYKLKHTKFFSSKLSLKDPQSVTKWTYRCHKKIHRTHAQKYI